LHFARSPIRVFLQELKVAKAAREGQQALAQTLVSSWQSTEDGLDLLLAKERYRRLHNLLATGRMKVRVVPRGPIHSLAA
jgi:hypothetical protein